MERHGLGPTQVLAIAGAAVGPRQDGKPLC